MGFKAGGGVPVAELKVGSFVIMADEMADITDDMQRVCPVEGDLDSYLANPGMLVTVKTRTCPFCQDGHELQLHGWYERWALLPGKHPPARIQVRRLLCIRVEKTVSLLPDFCLPRRQHGPAILGRFLTFLMIERRPLLDSLVLARGEELRHSAAQSLRNGFVRRHGSIREYLAMPPPDQAHGGLHSAAAVLHSLCTGFPDSDAAFTYHSLRFHSASQLGLA